jgi:hypothetical protein
MLLQTIIKLYRLLMLTSAILPIEGLNRTSGSDIVDSILITLRVQASNIEDDAREPLLPVYVWKPRDAQINAIKVKFIVFAHSVCCPLVSSRCSRSKVEVSPVNMANSIGKKKQFGDTTQPDTELEQAQQVKPKGALQSLVLCFRLPIGTHHVTPIWKQ